MITNVEFANQAKTGDYVGIPYKTLDCQAFVEKVLKDCGITKNWRGSNHMWRECLTWKGTEEQYKKEFGEESIPVGAWLFTLKDDGGEKERGYNDSQGNASHVGIYIGDNKVMHSSTGGVQISNYDRKRFNRVGLCRYIVYSGQAESLYTKLIKIKNDLESVLVQVAQKEE